MNFIQKIDINIFSVMKIYNSNLSLNNLNPTKPITLK